MEEIQNHPHSELRKKDKDMNNAQSEKIKIDSDKLRKLILEKEKSVDDCSTSLGYTKKYLAGCLSAGAVSKPISMLLELKHGIKPEDYLAEKQVF